LRKQKENCSGREWKAAVPGFRDLMSQKLN